MEGRAVGAPVNPPIPGIGNTALPRSDEMSVKLLSESSAIGLPTFRAKEIVMG